MANNIVVFSALSCFMSGNLIRKSGYFEQTLPSYLPGIIFVCMTLRETLEIYTREIMQTERLPLENASGRQVIAPEKQC